MYWKESHPPMNPNKIILLIDDEPIILYSLKVQLERLVDSDYIIEAASSGEEAIELLNEFHSNNNPVSLVISDFHLQEHKGTQILEHAFRLFPEVKKVILSGELEVKEIDEFHDKHHLHLKLSKPWNVNELVDLITNTA